MSETAPRRNRTRTWELVWFPRALAERVSSLHEKPRRALRTVILAGSRGLSIDQLESRTVLNADLAMLAATPIDPVTGEVLNLDPDPSEVIAGIGPGENTLVEGTPPVEDPSLPFELPTITDPDPNQIPVTIGPGDNTLVSGTPDLTDYALAALTGGSADSLADFGAEASPTTVTMDFEFTSETSDLDGTPSPTEITRPTSGTSAPPIEVASDPSVPVSSTQNTRLAASEIIDTLSDADVLTPEEIAQLHEAVDRWMEKAGIQNPHPMPIEEMFGDVLLPSGLQEHEPTEESSESHLEFQAGPLGLVGGLWLLQPRRSKRRGNESPSRRSSRRGNRRSIDGSITLQPHSANDSEPAQLIIARPRDISDRGLGIFHRGPLPTQTLTVSLPDEESIRSARVRWTQRLVGNIFASGIEFQNPAEDSAADA